MCLHIVANDDPAEQQDQYRQSGSDVGWRSQTLSGPISISLEEGVINLGYIFPVNWGITFGLAIYYDGNASCQGISFSLLSN